MLTIGWRIQLLFQDQESKASACLRTLPSRSSPSTDYLSIIRTWSSWAAARSTKTTRSDKLLNSSSPSLSTQATKTLLELLCSPQWTKTNSRTSFLRSITTPLNFRHRGGCTSFHLIVLTTPQPPRAGSAEAPTAGKKSICSKARRPLWITSSKSKWRSRERSNSWPRSLTSENFCKLMFKSKTRRKKSSQLSSASSNCWVLLLGQ